MTYTIAFLFLLVAGDVLGVISIVLLFKILQTKREDISISRHMLNLSIETAAHTQEKVTEAKKAAEEVKQIVAEGGTSGSKIFS